MGLGVRSLRVRRQEIGVRRQEIILFILPTTPLPHYPTPHTLFPVRRLFLFILPTPHYPTPYTLFQVSPDAKVGTAKDENIGIIFPK
ncbi:MAG: hypothetical protein O9326_14175 [Microcystis sp. LE19-338.1B]|nr:hypothetical protein [Microcystis sp. LE19-338.1B]MCZ8360365.1 hypothetical protein [Microcystis sp. LE19-388.1G]